ncbi:MAG TPA: nicotinate phosphoribosyltransferase [Balneola sp.]|jgi:nicotinate phosphoribosyltransferase|nr:nicotinate phosphoribosyltransferase [Balneola sp.]MAO78356.1 nicotinate phosphoribosyltransferase [Balneola sp.]MBF64356.1 nicotinate phosphoribosyltransferase [Balneola sp.]HBZ38394.1 nicotinate phosphoribosyltransferase [Balneola sp.]|tara:strand:- start:7617 stop:9020 length:1404 start_codon:yes stop_codon:yes gene_type:complete
MLKNYPGIYTDFYELTMAQGYFLSGRKQDTACFDYFFRKLPFKGGYTVFAGLGDLLDILKNYTFGNEEIEYLRTQGFKDEFLNYLRSFRLSCNIHSVKEGEIVFNNTPLVRVQGNIIETQIIETLLLNILNFESLIATKASRLKQVAGEKAVLDFGLRRSQGFGGIQASKASIIGGLNGSSNVYAGLEYGLDVSGTMAHSWVQSFSDELTAFQTYARHFPENTILLVDTYDTLKQGVPNAIKVAKELKEKGASLKAIRLDSGDLAYLSKKARKLLDDEGFHDVKIAVSNQLDEYLIKSLLDQKAPIDIFGVGTKLVTAYDDPALDGVYKLSSINKEPTLKISENVEKITLPDVKKVTRYYNKDGSFYADGISLEHEESLQTIEHPHFPIKKTKVQGFKSSTLLQAVMIDGKLTSTIPNAHESAEYCREQLKKLNPEYKRFDNPHVYKVGISKELKEVRDRIIQSNSN